MSRIANKGNRCKTCKMITSMCMCELLIKYENQTPVSILMHFRERITTTNTAHFANLLLKNSDIHYRGLFSGPIPSEEVLIPNRTPIYLFPSESSKELSASSLRGLKNIQLLVPDGSWRQAKKIAKREKFLKDIPHFKLPPTSSIFFLRRKVRPEGVSTLEAIACALGIIEGVEVQNHLLSVFRIMMERTLHTRGQKIENFMN